MLPAPCSPTLRGLRPALLGFLLVASLVRSLPAAVWQWSIPDETSRAYLWIPPGCSRVRAVILANHNMIEHGILEHPAMRRTLADAGIAEVWVHPALDATFDFHTPSTAPARFQRIISSLARESGYAELQAAPIIPLGHSASATFPWNFAAWAPHRTLAILSIKGDAPQTTLTGNGKPRIPWGDRHIDGIPALMVLGEYEWWEDRAAPAFAYQQQHPAATISLLCDAGRGHFDYSDALVDYLALFIRKAADSRLPALPPADPLSPPQLKPLAPGDGWRSDRWRPEGPAAPAAPFSRYTGNPGDAFWCFDQEMALATERLYAFARGKKPQLLGFLQDNRLLPQADTHEQVRIPFQPDADGITFHLAATFLDTVPGGSGNPAKWVGLPEGSPLQHAAAGPIEITRITGPVMRTGPTSFTLSLDRTSATPDRRNNDVWLLASHPGDASFKSALQQGLLRITPNTQGAIQTIRFDPLADLPLDRTFVPLTLRATSDASLPVRFFVREGPAEVEGDTLTFTPIPPRSRFPLKITLFAWQWGRPGIRTATPVERTFSITNPAR